MAFVMNGKTFETMMDIARELGRARVKRTDFEKLGVVEVENAEVIVETPKNDSKPAEEVVESPKGEVKEAVEEAVEEAPEEPEVEVKNDSPNNETEVEETPEEEVTGETETEESDKEVVPEGVKPEAEEKDKPSEDSKKPKMTEEEKLAKKKARREARKQARLEASQPTPEMLAKAEELRNSSGYTDIWDWAVEMKKKTAEEVVVLAEELGLTWDRHETQRIDRMRAVQTIRENLFPGEKRPRVRRSPWKGVPTEFVLTVAKEKGVDILVTDNDKVLRMHLLKALKGIGIATPEDAGYVEEKLEENPTV